MYVKNPVQKNKKADSYEKATPFQWCRKVKHIGTWGPAIIGGDNLPSLVDIGLTDLPNMGGASAVAPPGPPVPAPLMMEYIL